MGGGGSQQEPQQNELACTTSASAALMVLFFSPPMAPAWMQQQAAASGSERAVGASCRSSPPAAEARSERKLRWRPARNEPRTRGGCCPLRAAALESLHYSCWPSVLGKPEQASKQAERALPKEGTAALPMEMSSP